MPGYMPPTNAAEQARYAQNLAAGGANVQNFGTFNDGVTMREYGPWGVRSFSTPGGPLAPRPQQPQAAPPASMPVRNRQGDRYTATSSPAPQGGGSLASSPLGTTQAPAGPLAPGSLPEGISPVQSTIDGYSPIYTDNQSQIYANQQASKARQLGSPRTAMKRFSRPGMSHDEGTLAAAMPQITGARAAADNLLGTLPLQDAFANEQFMLSGQEAAGQETSQLANLLQQIQQAQDVERNSAIAAMLNPSLGSIFG